MVGEGMRGWSSLTGACNGCFFVRFGVDYSVRICICMCMNRIFGMLHGFSFWMDNLALNITFLIYASFPRAYCINLDYIASEQLRRAQQAPHMRMLESIAVVTPTLPQHPHLTPSLHLQPSFIYDYQLTSNLLSIQSV